MQIVFISSSTGCVIIMVFKDAPKSCKFLFAKLLPSLKKRDKMFILHRGRCRGYVLKWGEQKKTNKNEKLKVKPKNQPNFTGEQTIYFPESKSSKWLKCAVARSLDDRRWLSACLLSLLVVSYSNLTSMNFKVFWKRCLISTRQNTLGKYRFFLCKNWKKTSFCTHT